MLREEKRRIFGRKNSLPGPDNEEVKKPYNYKIEGADFSSKNILLYTEVIN